MEELEQATKRTLEFIEMLKGEFALFGIEPSTELFIEIGIKAAPVLATVQEHYELREQLAGAYSSAAYDYIMHKWHAQVPK